MFNIIMKVGDLKNNKFQVMDRTLNFQYTIFNFQ